MIDKTGGPAFPLPLGNAQIDKSVQGMTLRQYYAAHAPITLVDAQNAIKLEGGNIHLTGGQVLKFLALMRWRYADDMIAGADK